MTKLHASATHRIDERPLGPRTLEARAPRCGPITAGPLVTALAALLPSCGGESTTPGAHPEAVRGDCEGGACLTSLGRSLFTRETFGGNGRVCQTCHDLDDGQPSLDEIQAAFAKDPGGPLFRAIDSDDGTGRSYHRLTTHGTIVVELPLPGNVGLVTGNLPGGGGGVGDSLPTVDFGATIRVFRSILPTTNSGLEEALMWDGREHADLAHQAGSAIDAHYEPAVEPTAREKAAIAAFEREKLFSSKALAEFAAGGPAPTLPPGTTEAERRGRAFLVPRARQTGPGWVNCGTCHSGPMLNRIHGTANDMRISFGPFGRCPDDPGCRFVSTHVSEFNVAGNPVHHFVVVDPETGAVTQVQSPDPGRLLVSGRVLDANEFKIPTLWNVVNTSPYFHDNSAVTLGDVLDHYERFFDTFRGVIAEEGALIDLTEQDKADIIAYLSLL